jgi:hypothetical protein
MRDPEDVEYIAQLEAAIERLLAERKKLDRRIHNQRVALRENWEIVEMRGNWLGSPASRRRYHMLWKSYKDLKAMMIATQRG